ncbi:ABC transporter permease [Cellulomonas sp. zg-ZUI222]|uniref:Transport permease protein n=1 Tax=Cellulomonas wangleii TaxID=2816956 RepID=A0ABX8D646_9CELL|nr:MULTISPECIES: ABC transporter permease [Cellulomonas]MBO0899129.1 ABC transporter permease [Cellulomonas sp. zg-ZUI22]MBO0919979.1 ABC transporter permease [Cellulomonas wangleii]MBO0923592.1 ABC transporter permease [Cellulomonas wangleii]QVI61916.1 ABC transporter permease [Cellulomonas wangleii]
MTAQTPTPTTTATAVPAAARRGALAAAPAASRPRGGALLRMTVAEARLLVRDPAAGFFALGFPALLITVLGLTMPWADEPFDDRDPLLAQITAITGYTPIVLSLAVATVGLSSLPVAVATYRQRGVLKRLSATPVGPARLLVAQVLVYLGALVVAAVVALVCAVLVVGVTLPKQPWTVALAFLLGVLSTFAVGGLIAARAATTGAANGIGMTAYFISLFFAGVWTPLPIMPEAVQTIARYLPLGAASQAMTDAWVGAPFPTQQVLVMAAWALVGTPLAVRLFRWS